MIRSKHSVFLFLEYLSAWMLGNTVWWRVSITCMSMMAVSSSLVWKGLPSILHGMVNLAKGKVTASQTTSFNKATIKKGKLFKSKISLSFYYLFLSNRNDIAILRLADAVYDNGYVAIARRPAPDLILPHGFTCYITGWGLMDCEKTLMHTCICPMHTIYIRPLK